MFTRQNWIHVVTILTFLSPIAFAKNTSIMQSTTAQITQQQPCLMCDWKVAPEVANAVSADVCEDLLPAACIGPGGEYKTKALFDRIEKKLKEMVKTAQGKAAQQMGYKDFNDAAIKLLAKEGFALKKDISEKARKYILEGDFKNYVEKKEIYEVAAQCEEDKKKIETTKYLEIQELPKLLEFIKQIDDFQSKYQIVSAQFYSKDIPGLLNKIGAQCKAYETAKDDLKNKGLLEHPIVLKLQKLCSQKKELRQRAVDFYLKQDDPNTRDEIIKFVQENNDVINASLPTLKIEAVQPPVTDINNGRQKVMEKIYTLYIVCSSVEERIEGGPRQVTTQLLETTSTAKATVEYLIGQIYTPERKKIVQEIHSAAKREALVVAQRLTNDPRKIARIQDHYKRMIYTWFEKPAADKYKKDKKSGIDILDINRFDPSDVWNQAFGGNLEFFSSVNAFYIPDTKFGANERPLSVTMQPIFMEILDENRHSFLSVIAHEVGHNIGPMVTKINNYDLREEYTPLLQCLGSPDSIRMLDSQTDETVADVVSAEVMAKLISQLPAEKRKEAVMASMQTFCKFLDMGDEEMSVSLSESHPESILRISGIFGANKSLRKVMSCSGDAKKFRTCSLTGEP